MNAFVSFGILYFVLSCLMLLIKKKLILIPEFSYFSSLFPSWEFYDKLGHSSKLYIKTDNSKVWQPVLGNAKLQPWSLFFNPKLNHELLIQKTLMHICLDSQKKTNKIVEKSASFNLIKNYLLYDLNNTEFKSFKFKISVIDLRDLKIEEKLVVESRVYKTSGLP